MRMVGLLIVSAIVVFLAVQQLQKDGPTSQQVSTQIEQGASNVVDTNLVGAKQMLQLQLDQTGSYAGANLAGAGVTLVRADATSYCIQAAAGPDTEHLDGPNGAPTPGPC